MYLKSLLTTLSIILLSTLFPTASTTDPASTTDLDAQGNAFYISELQIPANGNNGHYFLLFGPASTWATKEGWTCTGDLGPDSLLQANLDCSWRWSDGKRKVEGLTVAVQQPNNRDPKAGGVNFIIDAQNE